MEGWRQDIYVKYGYVLTTIIGQDWVKLSKEYGFQLTVLPIEVVVSHPVIESSGSF